MRAIVMQRQGSAVAPNISAVEDWAALPPLAPGHVVVRTLATALNHMDIWVGVGIPGLDLEYPRISGCDACGVIEEVGPGVDRAWLGRRVIVNAKYDRPRSPLPDDPTPGTLVPDLELFGEHVNGMHREAFAIRVSACAVVGDDAEPVQAAAFGLTFLTAYSMMVTKARLRPGQAVLITGIGGGVATAALAIARWMGCPVCVTSRHRWKLDQAAQLGAEHTVLDTGEDWSRQVRDWTAKRGVDLAVDTVGRPTHLPCVKSLARGGAYVTAGNTAGPDATTDLARIFWNQLRVLGSTMGSDAEFAEIAALFRAGHLRPVIDSVHPWRHARSAWERLESAQQFGKVVIDWS